MRREGSFEQIGEWQPWRFNRSGQVICEVAAARFALRRPVQSDPPLEVEVALIRDWRKLLVVKGATEGADIQDWQADLTSKPLRFWEEGWQALPAPPPPTTPKLIPVMTTGQGMGAMEVVLPLSLVDNSAFSPNCLTIPIDPAYSAV